MAMIKALEGRTVHQIQSGQVIVDLCSVAKELVENSLDAGATSIEIRFKNHGLDSIEVQDNGLGISQENYETIALKHYTSKLSEYSDLSSLETFGFRGEALSSLCALSKFSIVTAREDEAPKGTRLDFDISGRLKSASVIASQRGTTVSVENLFHNLPVRRRELEKNIKREYGKVLSILQAYACISTQARISVSNLMAKGKKAVVFATKSNPTTRENIANVFGAKTLANLLSMNMDLELDPTGTAVRSDNAVNKQVRVVGHVSRPVFGEGRQAPDRQMFFVNSRPCGLPQVAKVFNEVYKSYNLSQSPFIFANIVLDTNAYDVNVSPDKRTILLHEQATLLDNLRASLSNLFDHQDQTMPQSAPSMNRLPSFKQLSVSRENPKTDDRLSVRNQASTSVDYNQSNISSDSEQSGPEAVEPDLVGKFAARGTTDRVQPSKSRSIADTDQAGLSKGKHKSLRKIGQENTKPADPDAFDDARDVAESDRIQQDVPRAVQDFNHRMAENAPVGKEDNKSNDSSEKEDVDGPSIDNTASPPKSSIVQNAFDRMRPRRQSPEVATVTIGSKTTTSILGASVYSQRKRNRTPNPSKQPTSTNESERQTFSNSMQAFAAPGSNLIQTVGPTRSKVLPSKPQYDRSKQAHDFSDVSDDDAESAGQETDDDQLGEVSSNDEEEPSPAESDAEYVDEDEKKAMEEQKVAEMIQQTEEAALLPSDENDKRARQALKGNLLKDQTQELMQRIDSSLDQIHQQLSTISDALTKPSSNEESRPNISDIAPDSTNDPSAPDRLTLTITKKDFPALHITGQFNLGFILATRNNTDLFIIDQHASDEKINFERLQATTVMQNQRLVHPRRLELTAVDEEIILENLDALEPNGFIVDVDESGDYPVGQRVSLTSLPMSKETTFRPSDLEELIALLADAPSTMLPKADGGKVVLDGTVPRPSKIRKLLAMRACRSSIMIGKVMTKGMMGRLVAKMGDIDKPWNCPHGRPTMRHVCGLEGLGVGEEEEEEEEKGIDWKAWLAKVRNGEGEEWGR